MMMIVDNMQRITMHCIFLGMQYFNLWKAQIHDKLLNDGDVIRRKTLAELLHI